MNMNSNIEKQMRLIKIHFLPCDFSDFWSRLNHYGLTVTNRGNQFVHVLLQIGCDAYELLIEHGITFIMVTKSVERLIKMKASATITLTPIHESSFNIVNDNIVSMVDEGRSLEPHGLIDWIYGDDEGVYLCTDFVKEALEIGNPQKLIKTPVEMFRWLSQQEYLKCGSGIYKVDTSVSDKVEL